MSACPRNLKRDGVLQIPLGPPLPKGDVRGISSAKLFATEAASRNVNESLQIHGGAGLEKGARIERLYREVRALTITRAPRRYSARQSPASRRCGSRSQP